MFFLRENTKQNQFEKNKIHISAPTSAIFNACSVFIDIVAHDALTSHLLLPKNLACNSFFVPVSLFSVFPKLIHFSFGCLDCNKFAVGVILVLFSLACLPAVTVQRQNKQINIYKKQRSTKNESYISCARVCAFEGTFCRLDVFLLSISIGNCFLAMNRLCFRFDLPAPMCHS